jgi:hypothetical protein
MQNERDVWNTIFYHRAIRRQIGDALSAGYDLSQPPPDTIRTLLVHLDEQEAESATSRRCPPTTAVS